MNEPLFSESTFRWIMTIFTAAGCAWVLYDVTRLIRLRGASSSDPSVRDKRFGYWIGIAIGAIGVIGLLRYHDIL